LLTLILVAPSIDLRYVDGACLELSFLMLSWDMWEEWWKILLIWVRYVALEALQFIAMMKHDRHAQRIAVETVESRQTEDTGWVIARREQEICDICCQY